MLRWLGFLVLLFPVVANAAAPSPLLRDRDGDPLPAGARLRLGTARFRTIPPGYYGLSVVLSADRRLMACTAPGGVVRVCSTATGKPISRVELPGVEQFPGAFSPDNRLLATIGADARVRVWDNESGRLRLDTFAGSNPPRHALPPLRVAFGHGGKTLATWDVRGQLIVRDAATGKVIRAARFAVDGSSASFSPDGSRLAVRTAKRTLRVEDTGGGRPIFFPLPKYTALCCAWSADGGTIAVTGHGSDEVVLLDLKTRQIRSWVAGDWSVTFLPAFSPDGKTLAVEDKERINLFDVATSKRTGVLATKHQHRLDGLHFLDRGRLQLSGQGVISTWDVRSGQALPQPVGPTSPIRAFSFGDSGAVLAGASTDGMLHVWDAKTGKHKGRVEGPAAQQFFSYPSIRIAGGTAAYSPSWNQPLMLIDTTPARMRGQVRTSAGQAQVGLGALGAVGALGGGVGALGNLGGAFGLSGGSAAASYGLEPFALSPSGRRLAVPQSGGPARPGPSIEVFSTATRTLQRRLDNPRNAALAFSPDGDFLALVASEGGGGQFGLGTITVELVEVRTGQVRYGQVHYTGNVSDPFTQRITRVLFSRDGRLIVALRQQDVYLFERFTLSLIKKVQLSPQFTWSEAALTADDRVLLAGHRALSTTSRYPSQWAVLDVETNSFLWSLDQIAFRNVGGDLALCGDTWTIGVAQDDTSILLYDIPHPKRRKSPEPNPRRLESLWDDLASDNAPRAHEARLILAQHPARALPLLRERLKPAADKIPRQLLTDLDSDDYDVREAATTKLRGRLAQGERAVELALRQLLETTPSLEVRRRVGRLLKPYANNTLLPPSEERRAARAVAVLERIGSVEAVALLKKLADGGTAVLTQEARAALDRMRAR